MRRWDWVSHAGCGTRGIRVLKPVRTGTFALAPPVLDLPFHDVDASPSYWNWIVSTFVEGPRITDRRRPGAAPTRRGTPVGGAGEGARAGGNVEHMGEALRNLPSG